MPVILITGASSGLGAAFVEAYVSQPETTILALDLSQAQLQETPNIKAFTVDISSQDSVTAFTRSLDPSVHIDLLIHCAGVRGLVREVEKQRPDDVAACETLAVMDCSTMLHTFLINSAGTFVLIKALLPHLARCVDPATTDSATVQAKVVVMSSRMGSISNNQRPNKDAGSAYAYRASKAALNQIIRSFAADVPEVVFVLCHPGRVETKLVKCVEEGAISAEESVGAMLKLIDRWGKENSGHYYDRFGEVILW